MPTWQGCISGVDICLDKSRCSFSPSWDHSTGPEFKWCPVFGCAWNMFTFDDSCFSGDVNFPSTEQTGFFEAECSAGPWVVCGPPVGRNETTFVFILYIDVQIYRPTFYIGLAVCLETEGGVSNSKCGKKPLFMMFMWCCQVNHQGGWSINQAQEFQVTNGWRSGGQNRGLKRYYWYLLVICSTRWPSYSQDEPNHNIHLKLGDPEWISSCGVRTRPAGTTHGVFQHLGGIMILDGVLMSFACASITHFIPCHNRLGAISHNKFATEPRFDMVVQNLRGFDRSPCRPSITLGSCPLS